MNGKRILAGLIALLLCFVMTASACYVCGSATTPWVEITPHKHAGDTVRITAPLQTGVTYTWLMNYKSLPSGSVVTKTFTDADSDPNEIQFTLPADDCNYELGIILTMSSPSLATCSLAKCIWFTVDCPGCPDLNSFCEGHAVTADANKFAIAGVNWKIDDVAFPATGQTILEGSNAITVSADTVKTAKMYIGTRYVCEDTFNVYNMPDNFALAEGTV